MSAAESGIKSRLFRSRLRFSDCSRRHFAIASWLPLRRTSGTSSPRKLARPGVLRILEPARLAVRLVGRALLVAQHAGDEPDHRVDHHHRRHFAAVADEVADRNLPRVQHLPDAVVEPLVPAAQEQQPRLLRQLLDRPLRQPLAGRRQHHQLARRLGLRLHRLDAVDHRLRHQHHAGAAAERPVVHPLVLVLRPVADVPGVDLRPARPGSRRPAGSGRRSPRRCPGTASARRSGSSRSTAAPAVAASTPFGRVCASAALAFAASSAALAASCASISSHFFMYFLKITAHCSDGSAPTLIQYLIRARLQRDALVLVRRRAGRRCPAPRSPGRRAAGGASMATMR